MILANVQAMLLKKLAQADYDCCLRTFGGNNRVREATIAGARISIPHAREGAPALQYRYSQEEQRVRRFHNDREEPFWILAIRDNNAIVASTGRRNVDELQAEIDNFIKTPECKKVLGEVEILP